MHPNDERTGTPMTKLQQAHARVSHRTWTSHSSGRRAGHTRVAEGTRAAPTSQRERESADDADADHKVLGGVLVLALVGDLGEQDEQNHTRQHRAQRDERRGRPHADVESVL
eukprot:4630430-Prymnesium_polylepis.1